jgi:aminoglycoside phosphotransferase
MWKIWVPRILQPDFTWSQRMEIKLSQAAPAIPSVTHPIIRRGWGIVHRVLERFSYSYCSWFDLPPPGGLFYTVSELPFGLVLKWTERTRIEEVVAMKMARAAGIPVPRVLSYGEHPDDIRQISILMTRLPGWPLNNSYDILQPDAEVPWLDELRRCLCQMRTWPSPFNKTRICSVIGTSISSHRVPNHTMGPVETEEELHEYLLSASSSHGFQNTIDYEKSLVVAKRILNMPHKMFFTHGDLQPHNILVDQDNRLSGILDWECAGWCPEYWEFTTVMRFGLNSWWYQVVSFLGGDQYLAELECDRELNSLTVDSYVG